VATSKDGGVGRRLQTLFNVGVVRELTDGQLLERFATGRGEGAELAFAALVERHGPMVLRVARGVLDDTHEAQDAFQATFLVLVAKARGLWARDSLGPWLHQVAYRTASCQRSGAARRRRLDRRAAVVEEAGQPELVDDLARILHEEINRLPERLRVAVVLCDLEGRTHEQASRALGWPVGTVKSRQARARERLRDRLTRRGVAPALGLLAIRPVLGSSIPITLLDGTTAAAIRFVTPRAIVPGTVAALAREVIQAMTILRWAKAAPFLLALGVTSGAGLIAQNQGGNPGDAPKPPETTQPAPSTDPSVVEVKPGKLNLTLSERGVVEPSKTLDVLSGVEGNTTITRILPERTQVRKGELVAELDSATLRDQLTNQKIAEQQAQTSFELAMVNRQIAEFAVKEYVERVGPQQVDAARAKIANAQAGIERGKARLERTKLARKRLDEARERRAGAESSSDVVADLTVADRLDAAELDIQTLTLDFETAKGQKELLEKYTLAQNTKRLQADVENAKIAELAKQSAWELEKVKTAKLERQIKSCKLLAPGDGLLVHANEPQRIGGKRQLQIEEGATVRERQKIFAVIDLAEPMRINAKVPESLVDQVKLGDVVRIKVDAIPDQVLTGVVRDVAPQADTGVFLADNKKVYTTLIQVDKGGQNLRPGMSASVDILHAVSI